MVIANARKLADEAGIILRLINRLQNSHLALTVSEFARENGKFNNFHKLIFVGYWKEGKDIGDLSLLLDLAESIGLNRNEIMDYIQSDEPYKKLRKIKLTLRKYGVNGESTFILDDKIVVGA